MRFLQNFFFRLLYAFLRWPYFTDVRLFIPLLISQGKQHLILKKAELQTKVQWWHWYPWTRSQPALSMAQSGREPCLSAGLSAELRDSCTVVGQVHESGSLCRHWGCSDSLWPTVLQVAQNFWREQCDFTFVTTNLSTVKYFNALFSIG